MMPSSRQQTTSVCAVDSTVDEASIETPLAPKSAPTGLDIATHALWQALDSQRVNFGNEFIDALLEEPSSSDSMAIQISPNEVPRPWKGLSNQAFYKTLLHELSLWGGSGIFPLSFATGPLLPCCTTNAEGEILNEVSPTDSPEMFRTLAVTRAARESSVEAYTEAINRIGKSGITRLLGCRVTTGSAPNVLPPLRGTLIAAAGMRVGRKRGAKLTVAARALMKHCGRRGEGWGHCYWGSEHIVMHGGDEEKNRRAADVVKRVLDQCVWMNVHHAPGGTQVLELRVESGHGVRWHALDAVFRGFLEPHSKEIAHRRKEERVARDRGKDRTGNLEGELVNGHGLSAQTGEIVTDERDEDVSRKLGDKVAQAMAIFSA